MKLILTEKAERDHADTQICLQTGNTLRPSKVALVLDLLPPNLAYPNTSHAVSADTHHSEKNMSCKQKQYVQCDYIVHVADFLAKLVNIKKQGFRNLRL